MQAAAWMWVSTWDDSEVRERGSEWVVGVGVVIAPLHHKREPETRARRMAASSEENHSKQGRKHCFSKYLDFS